MERLGSLKITEEALSKDIQTDTEIFTVLAGTNENAQAEMLRNMVSDLGWFDGDQTKFKNWWRGIRLFLKSNRVIGMDNRVTVILACLRGGVAGIYTQKKLDEIDNEEETQNWEDFIQEIKNTFSNKMKTADAKWKIETFK